MTPEVAQTLLCAALFWTSFCRLVRTSEETLVTVRAGLFGVAAAALVSAVSPWAWDAKATWFGVALVAGVLTLQLATSRFWRFGVPAQFQRSICAIPNPDPHHGDLA